MTEAEPPAAVLRPRRRISAAWILPVLAVAAAGWLGYAAWSGRGVDITILLDEGHGLKPNDPIRFRGVTVGEIRSVNLSFQEEGVVVAVEATLKSEAAEIARGGSRFWVVRPQVGLGGVAGLETLMGPRYLAVLPGDGEPRTSFIGLAERPVVESIDPGDLEVIVHADKRGGLRPDAPVRYRGVRVGTILSVGLASDAGGVEARVHIEKAYRALVRAKTRFWDIGGVKADVGLTGVSVEVESLTTLLAGGVALATPPDAGDMVRTGHRFRLADRAEKEWLEWQPLVVVGSSMLPPGAPMPCPLRAKIGWRESGIFRSSRTHQGWVLQTERGLLGPRNLLVPSEDADRESVVLEVAGEVVSLRGDPAWQERGAALLEARVSKKTLGKQRRRHAAAPEDCVAIADPTALALPLAAARLTPRDRDWLVDEAIPIDEVWHGACVLARSDGRLVGLLLVEDDVARVTLLPENW